MPSDTEITPEWCLNMARLEGNHEIGAGSPDHPLRALTPTASEATAIGAGEVDWAAVGREYAQKSLSGGVPQVRSPQYALSGVFTAMADEIERLRNAASPKVASDTAKGVREAELREAIRKAKLAAGTVYGIAWHHLEEVSRFELFLAALTQQEKTDAE